MKEMHRIAREKDGPCTMRGHGSECGVETHPVGAPPASEVEVPMIVPQS
jgi:hypothetical protein